MGNYAPYTWHDGETGGTLVTAARLNALEQGVAAAGGNPLAVTAYGAVGDGTTDDRAAIQAAITAAGSRYTATGSKQQVVIPPGVFLVTSTPYTLDSGTVQGLCSLVLADGVELTGPGTIKVAANSYGAGAIYRAVTAKSGGVSNAAVTGITIDGNRANQTASTQCSNLDVPALSNVTIRNVRSLNANGNGLRLTGSTTTTATNLAVTACEVRNAAYIGIQVSHFTGLEIGGNFIKTTGDNGIDVYGQNGTTTVDSRDFTIHDNRILEATTAVFAETVASGAVHDNTATSCTAAGIHVNRINGQPNTVTVHDNIVRATPIGIDVTGDTGGILVHHNMVTAATVAAVRLGSGSGNVSYVYVTDNFLDTTGGIHPLVLAGGNQIAHVRIRGTVTTGTDRSWDFLNQATITSDVTAQAANA